MTTDFFTVKARSNTSLDKDWREQLVALLGSKPRRLSRWCELGLYGALACVRQAGQTTLADDVTIRVYSESATINATRLAIQQATEHLPMPFTFMQTQPCQIFNALGAALGWHGDGYTMSSNERRHSEIAALRGVRSSALLAWVDEEPELINRWIWLERMDSSDAMNWQKVDSIFQTSADARWLKIDSDNAIFEGD